jgi:hypothetical protein
MSAGAPQHILARIGLRMPSAPWPTRWRPSMPCERLVSSPAESGHEGHSSSSTGKDGLRAAHVPEPEVGDGDVLVKVSAAGINPLDTMVRNGEFKRLLKYQTRSCLATTSPAW